MVRTKATKVSAAILLLAFMAAPLLAQNSEIEVGGLGLISDYSSLNVANGGASGKVGPDLGFSGGFVRKACCSFLAMM